MRALLANIRRAQEKHKAILARTLHDDISQKLTALSIELSLLQRRLGSHPESAKVGELVELSSQASASVRQLSNGLRSKVLDAFGLMAALKHECQQAALLCERSVEFLCDAGDPKMEASVADEVFGLFQEALALAMRSSPSGKIKVTVSTPEDCLRFSLDCPRFLVTGDPLGWLDVRERALSLNGKATLQKSKRGSGLLVLEMPLKKPDPTQS